MDVVNAADDVFSQRMRMVTGSLNPLVVADKNEIPSGKVLVEQEEDEELEDMETLDDEAFDPEQFHLEDLLSRMPSPDPDTFGPQYQSKPMTRQASLKIP